MKGDSIPEDHDVARHCKSDGVAEGDDGPIATGNAFLPYHPDGISVTWVQYFKGTVEDQIAEAAAAIRLKRIPGKSHRLALLNVGLIVRCGKEHCNELTVEHDPDPVSDPNGNPAHCLIQGIPENAEVFREALARQARIIPFPPVAGS